MLSWKNLKPQISINFVTDLGQTFTKDLIHKEYYLYLDDIGHGHDKDNILQFCLYADYPLNDFNQISKLLGQIVNINKYSTGHLNIKCKDTTILSNIHC